MGRVSKPTSPREPRRARGGVCWEGAVMEAASSPPISLLSAFVKAGGVLPLPESLFEGPEPGCLKWFPKMWILVQPCGVGSGAGLQAIRGLSGCAMSDVEKWAPVGNPLTSRPSLWASSLACGNGGGAWSPVGHVPGLAPLGAWSRL